jgi:predicted transcriptional regulator
LSRSFDEVLHILSKNGWVQGSENEKYKLTYEGLERLKSMLEMAKEAHLDTAAYGKINKMRLLEILQHS